MKINKIGSLLNGLTIKIKLKDQKIWLKKERDLLVRRNNLELTIPSIKYLGTKYINLPNNKLLKCCGSRLYPKRKF